MRRPRTLALSASGSAAQAACMPNSQVLPPLGGISGVAGRNEKGRIPASNRNRKMFIIPLRLLLGAMIFFCLQVTAGAEVGQVRLARQLGLGYLQFYIMQDQKLVEKHARGAGL